MPNNHVGPNAASIFQRTEPSTPTKKPTTPTRQEVRPRTAKTPKNTSPQKEPAQTAEPRTMPTEARSVGRPRTRTEAVGRIPLEIPIRQITYLDTISTTIRSRSGTIIKRVDLLRAMLDAIEGSSIDLTTATSRDDLREIIAAHLK